jgi:hypothetical protein
LKSGGFAPTAPSKRPARSPHSPPHVLLRGFAPALRYSTVACHPGSCRCLRSTRGSCLREHVHALRTSVVFATPFAGATVVSAASHAFCRGWVLNRCAFAAPVVGRPPTHRLLCQSTVVVEPGGWVDAAPQCCSPRCSPPAGRMLQPPFDSANVHENTGSVLREHVPALCTSVVFATPFGGATVGLRRVSRAPPPRLFRAMSGPLRGPQVRGARRPAPSARPIVRAVSFGQEEIATASSPPKRRSREPRIVARPPGSPMDRLLRVRLAAFLKAAPPRRPFRCGRL